jgi:hypothetical protein
MRTLSKADKMRALEERARYQQSRAQEYERVKVRQQEADKAKAREAEERQRQHRIEMKEIKAGKRTTITKPAAAKKPSPLAVEIFVAQAPHRVAAPAKSWREGDTVASRKETASRSATGPHPDVIMTSRVAPTKAGGSAAPNTLFFVPLLTTAGDTSPTKKSQSRSSGRSPSTQHDSAPRGRTHSAQDATAAASSRGRSSGKGATESDSDDVPDSPPPASADDDEAESDTRAVPSPRLHHSPPHSAVVSPLRVAQPQLRHWDPTKPLGPRTVADVTPHLDEPSSPAPLLTEPSRGSTSRHVAKPMAATVVKPQPALRDEADHSALLLPTTPHETSRASDHSFSRSATAPSVPQRPPPANDRHADEGLVSVVEWNVDLIRRQVRRFVDPDVMERLVKTCRAFAHGPSETRANPRANAAVMAKLGAIVGSEGVLTDIAPLLFQLIALEATLATAEQLRAVESLGDAATYE